MNTRLSALVLILTFLTPVVAQGKKVEWPDTPAAKWMEKFVALFEKEGRASIEEFVEESYSEKMRKGGSIGKRIEAFDSVRKQAGPLVVAKVSTDGDWKAKGLARSKKMGIWLSIDLELDAQAPHDEKKVSVLPSRGPEEAPIPDYADGWSSFGELVKRVHADTKAPALAVAVIQAGKLVDSAVSGVRQAGRDEKAKITDRFHIGSITKSVTATIAARLVERKILRWDMTIGEVFTRMDIRDDLLAVTLEQLLTHRAGIPPLPARVDWTRTGTTRAKGPVEGRRVMTTVSLLHKPDYPPGKGFKYSNAGYTVAGHLIETVAKKPWETLVAEEVLTPLGLATSGCGWPATKARPDQPRGHFGAPPDFVVQKFEEGMNGDIDLARFLAPAGDVHMSITELARYGAMHVAGLRGAKGPLAASTVRRIHTPPKGRDYAMGWVIRQTEDKKPLHWHNGSGGSFYAYLALYPESDLVIAAAVNCGPAVEPWIVNMTAAIRARRLRDK